MHEEYHNGHNNESISVSKIHVMKSSVRDDPITTSISTIRLI